MELPVHQPGLHKPQTLTEVQSLLIAVQANLVQLRVEAQRRKIDSLSRVLLDVAAPGVVRQFRQTLIDRQAIKNCTDLELLLQLHENWGQYCAISWLLSGEADESRDREDKHEALSTLKCETSIRIKLAEVHAFAWRFRFELDSRRSGDSAAMNHHQASTNTANQIPAEAFGQSAEHLNESELMLAVCEHVGLLSVLRWSLDNQSHWLDPSLSTIDDEPFPDVDSDK